MRALSYCGSGHTGTIGTHLMRRRIR